MRYEVSMITTVYLGSVMFLGSVNYFFCKQIKALCIHLTEYIIMCLQNYNISSFIVSKVFTIFSCVETPETGLFKNHALIHFQSLFISDFTIIIAKQNILLQD